MGWTLDAIAFSAANLEGNAHIRILGFSAARHKQTWELLHLPGWLLKMDTFGFLFRMAVCVAYRLETVRWAGKNYVRAFSRECARG